MTTKAEIAAEKQYWDFIRTLSPQEKFRVTAKMSADYRASVAAEIRKEQPTIGERALKFAVARHIYWEDAQTMKLLDEAEKTANEVTRRQTGS